MYILGVPSGPERLYVLFVTSSDEPTRWDRLHNYFRIRQNPRHLISDPVVGNSQCLVLGAVAFSGRMVV